MRPSEIQRRWRERPDGPHRLCAYADLVIGDRSASCPDHGLACVVLCWALAFGHGTGRPPCLACTDGLERALEYASRFRTPDVPGTGSR
jgi:hypothetical protein